MRIALALAGLASLLVACGPSLEDFNGQVRDLDCELMFDCVGEEYVEYLNYDSVDECKDNAPVSAEDDESCDYDQKAAEDCMEAKEALTCDDYNSGAMPIVCTTVCG